MHDATKSISISQVLESDPSLFRETRTHAPGPEGVLPITAEMLLTQPSGNLFGLSQNAGMGWEPARLLDSEFLILSTHGGMRAEDGTPIALGFHTGHWEVGLLVAEAARELRRKNAIPFAGACTDPCDGRTQGTAGMLDSLAYRNDAAIVLRRLMRSLPTRKGVIGVATCDKGLPAMMMALASSGALPSILVPGGVTLLPENGEDAGKVQTHRRALCAESNHARVCGRGGLSSLCHTGWRMPVSGHCRDLAGGCRGPGVVTASRCTRAFGSIDLARRGHAVGSRYVADGSDWSSAPPMFCPMPRFAMRWCCTRPSGDRRTCCYTFPPSRMPLDCAGPRQPTGHQSIVRFHVSWTRFRMGRTTSRPCKYFLREECRR